MKALSIQQPWANLIISKKKKIEIRNWKLKDTPLQVYIHVSRNKPKILPKGFNYTDENIGKVIGKVNIKKEVKEYKSLKEFKNDFKKHLITDERLMKKYYKKDKTYGYILEFIKRYDEPFKRKGSQRLFEIKRNH